MQVIKIVLKQTSWQILGKVVASFSTVVILGIITRTYGESGTGLYTLVLTYLGFFFLAADFGLNGFILPKLSDQPSLANEQALSLGNKLFNLRFYWSLVLINIANLLTLVLPFSTKDFQLAVLFGSFAILFYGIINSANLIFQSKLKYNFSVLASSVGALIAVPIIYYFAKLNFPVSLLVLATTINLLITSLLSLFFLRHKIFSLELPNLSSYLRIFKAAWMISLTLIVNTLYFRVDTFILASVRDLRDVGVYNLAYSIFQTILVLPTFIMNAYYPLMLKSLKNNRQIFFKQIRLALGMLGILGLLGGVLTYFFSPLAINILTGGGFAGSVEVLRILSLSLPAFFATALLMWVYVSLKKYKQMLIIYSLGLLINFIFNLILIPKLSFIGSALTTVVSEYLILASMIVILYKELKVISTGGDK